MTSKQESMRPIILCLAVTMLALGAFGTLYAQSSPSTTHPASPTSTLTPSMDSLLDGIDNPHPKTATPANNTNPPPASAPTASAPTASAPTASAPPVATTPPKTDTAAYEETSMVVVRTILVTAHDGTKEEIHIPVPIYYRSRSIAFTPDQVARAADIKRQLDAIIAKLVELKAQEQALAQTYNSLIAEGVPKEALTGDSPTLPAYTPDAGGGIQSSAITIDKNQ